MHVALVTQGVPEPQSGGSALINWGILNSLRNDAHQVTVCVLLSAAEAEAHDGLEHRLAPLVKLGAQVEVLSFSPSSSATALPLTRAGAGRLTWYHELRRATSATLIDDYPAAALASELRRLLERIEPDVVYVFDCGPAAALRDFHLAPRMVVLGDPYHLVWRHRLRHTRRVLGRSYPLQLLACALSTRRLQRRIVEAVTGYESIGWFGAQHAAWLQAQGVPCRSVRPPVVDMAGPDWEKRRRACPPRAKPKIVMLGHLLGTANLSGLHPFVRETLPRLERRLGPDRFEVHIIGRDEPPADLAQGLRRPAIRLRGHVEDLEMELLSSDVLLAPSAYPVGMRMRILTALSFGCCVVAHRLSAHGIPELVSGENCLLGSDGHELAECIVRVLNDEPLRRRLGQNARAAYARDFSLEHAGAWIVAELERLAHERRRRRSADGQAAYLLGNGQ